MVQRFQWRDNQFEALVTIIDSEVFKILRK